VHTYQLAPNSAAAAAGKVWRRLQPNFGRRADRISTAPAIKVMAARLRGLPWPPSTPLHSASGPSECGKRLCLGLREAGTFAPRRFRA